jgi:hypothetical protein
MNSSIIKSRHSLSLLHGGICQDIYIDPYAIGVSERIRWKEIDPYAIGVSERIRWKEADIL